MSHASRGKMKAWSLSRQYSARSALLAQSLKSGHDLALINTSNSMRPVVNPGTRLTIASLPAAITLGDLIAFDAAAGLRVHRLLAIDGDRYLVKGDALDRADGWIARAQIVGVVTHIDGHDVTTPTWRWVNRQIAKVSPHSSLLWRPLRLVGKVRRRLGLRWL